MSHSQATPDPRDAKREAALNSIQERLVAVEAAIADLKDKSLVFVDRDELKDPIYQARYANRVRSAAFHLAHLTDDVKRLGKHCGIKGADLDKVLDKSVPIRVVRRLNDDGKHGLGGRDKTATLLNGFMVMERKAKGATEKDRIVHVNAMQIVDSEEGAFYTSKLLPAAVQHWGNALSQVFGVDDAWARRIAPSNEGRRVVVIKAGEKPADVPLGSIVELEPPKELVDQFQEDARRRGREA